MQYVGCLFALSAANPLPVTPFTEIQIVDHSHFTIEFDLGMAGGYRQPYPDHIDSIYLFCSPDSSTPPADSMKGSAKVIGVDTNGMALITEEYFPDILLEPGNYLHFSQRGNDYYPPFALPDTFSSGISFVSGYSDPVCCDGREIFGANCVMYCRSLVYKGNRCPSPGIRNREQLVEIHVNIRDSSDNPVSNIQVMSVSETLSPVMDISV